MSKKWADAAEIYQQILDKYPKSTSAPAAVYWLGVSTYQRTHNAQDLGNVVTELKQKYPESPWNRTVIPWAA